MAHYAFLNEDNIVVEVIPGIDENELIEDLSPELWYSQFRKMNCVRTSYNGKIRKQFAGIGFTYNPVADVFIAPQPFPSWSLDDNHDWQAPKPKPVEGFWIWDEEIGDWVEETESVA
jgi:hypothetical protein